MNQEQILKKLSAEDAAAVLARLCRDDAGLTKRAAEIADELLQTHADVDGIAADLQFELDFTDVEELWDRCGGQRDGYHEPSEEAFEMCEEILQPMLDQWRRYRELGRLEDAKHYCMGLLLGVHLFETESKTEFREWAEDVPGSLADRILSTWREWCPSPQADAEVTRFLQERCPEFAELGN
jgi:hypothetical protein